MKLSPADAAAFLKLWSHLDAYANGRLGIVPGATAPANLRGLSPAKLYEIREGFWSRPELLEGFLKSNPFGLSPAELEDVARFRHAVRGRFFIERCLKDYAILIAVEGSRVYAVRGLTEGIDEFAARAAPGPLPLLAATTLLPFRGKIVWDGLVSFDAIYFGPGIRRDLKAAYTRAKDRGEIVGSLDEGPVPLARPKRVDAAWGATLEKIVHATDALGRPDTSLQAAAIRLLKASARVARTALAQPRDDAELASELRKAERALHALAESLARDES